MVAHRRRPRRLCAKKSSGYDGDNDMSSESFSSSTNKTENRRLSTKSNKTDLSHTNMDVHGKHPYSSRQDSFDVDIRPRQNRYPFLESMKTQDPTRPEPMDIGVNPAGTESFTDRMNRKIPFFGLWMSLLSALCYSMCSLIVKILTDLHALEILGIRSTFQIMFYLAAVIIYRLPMFGIPGNRIPLGLRAIFGASAAITIYMSYRMIPLADATTIQFSAPILVFILAYFMLGERLTPYHIIIGLMALAGVMFVSKPSFMLRLFNENSLKDKVSYEGIILAIIAMITTAFGMIMLRKLKTTPVHVVVLWFSVLTTISAFGCLHLFAKFVWPKDLTTWLWLVAIGLGGIGDQLFMTLAFKYESAGVISVSRTLTIVLAFIWDTVLLSVQVHWTSVVGSLLVMGSIIGAAILRSFENHPDIGYIIWNKIFCCCPKKLYGRSTPDEREKLTA